MIKNRRKNNGIVESKTMKTDKIEEN